MRVLGEAIATESAKKVAEHTYREAKKAVAKPHVRKALVAAAKSVGVPLAKATLVGATIATALAVGGNRLTANREREAKAWANKQLAITKKKLPQLTKEQAATLWQQYYDHAMKAPVTNPFLGK